MNYILHLIVYSSMYVVIALSLNIVVGFCGLLTLSHAAYFAIGAYVYAITTMTLGWGVLPTLLLCIAVNGVLSLAVSLPAWRFKGDFFVLISLAVQVVIFSLIYNWIDPEHEIGTIRNLTNGSIGIS